MTSIIFTWSTVRSGDGCCAPRKPVRESTPGESRDRTGIRWTQSVDDRSASDVGQQSIRRPPRPVGSSGNIRENTDAGKDSGKKHTDRRLISPQLQGEVDRAMTISAQIMRERGWSKLARRGWPAPKLLSYKGTTAQTSTARF